MLLHQWLEGAKDSEGLSVSAGLMAGVVLLVQATHGARRCSVWRVAVGSALSFDIGLAAWLALEGDGWLVEELMLG